MMMDTGNEPPTISKKRADTLLFESRYASGPAAAAQQSIKKI